MIIVALVDGDDEIFVTFHKLKSCRSITRCHSVLYIKGVHSPNPLLLGNCFFVSCDLFVGLCMDWALSTCISEEMLHLQLHEAISILTQPPEGTQCTVWRASHPDIFMSWVYATDLFCCVLFCLRERESERERESQRDKTVVKVQYRQRAWFSLLFIIHIAIKSVSYHSPRQTAA